MVQRNSILSEAEGIQILSVFAHRAPCGAPEILRGELPITLERIAVWREALAGAAQSPQSEAVGSALIFAEALLSPLAARRKLVATVRRWKLGEVFDSLGRSLAGAPQGAASPEWLRELEDHLQACRETLRVSPGGPSRSKRRRGRLLRTIAAILQPVQAWRELPAAAEAFLRGGRAADAARLRQVLESAADSMSRRQRQLVEKLLADLSHFDRPSPSLGEVLRRLDLLAELPKGMRCGTALPKWVREAQLEIRNADRLHGSEEEEAWRDRFDETLRRIARLARPPLSESTPTSPFRQALRGLDHYLSRRRMLVRIRVRLARLLEGPQPRVPASKLRRRQAQLAQLAGRWFRAGARATAARLRAIPTAARGDESTRRRNSIRILDRLALGEVEGREEAYQLAEQLLAPASHAPTGDTLAFLLETCRAAESVPGTDPKLAALREAAAALSQFAKVTAALVAFVNCRVAALEASHPASLREFLTAGRFSFLPPESHDGNDLAAWLLAIPTGERVAVLEFLHLGPVRNEVLRAALAIARVESAARRHPRLSPEQFAACVAGLDQSRELSEILARELIAPRLSRSEQQHFGERLQSIRAQRDERGALRLGYAATTAGDDLAPFFESPFAEGERLERSRRKAALELAHSMSRAGLLDEGNYRGVIDQHWRRPASRADRWDRDRRRPSLVEQMLHFARQTHAAARAVGDPPPSLESLVWSVWTYLKSNEEIAARWRERVPTGQRRGPCRSLLQRSESGDPGDFIEHVRLALLKFFDLEAIVARARESAAAVTEEELHEVRAVDLLLFDCFGEEGMLLPAATYAAPLAAATRQSLEALAPLAAHDIDVRRLCAMLAQLAPFYAKHCPWAEALDFGHGGPRETIHRWRQLLEDVRNTSRRMKRSKALAGELLPAWQAAADLLGNQQVFLRLQLAMRVAVERDDPTCRHLCASRSLVAQLAAERVGLAQRRRFHRRSEAAIFWAKLCARRHALLSLPPALPWIQAEAIALADDCQTLLALHAAPATPAQRQAAIDCGDRIQRRARELRAVLAGVSPEPNDVAVVEAASSVAATAGDLVDGFFIAKQRKGLQTLIGVRAAERLDDTLARC